MFLDAPLVMYARLAGEVTGQRLSRFGRAFEFDQADEHAGGFGRGQVIDQSLPFSRAQSEPKAHEREHAAKPWEKGNKRSNVVHRRQSLNVRCVMGIAFAGKFVK